MKNCHISLIRCGKTAANDEGRYIGTSDLPLTDRARNDLLDKMDRFVYPRPEIVYCSPLQRCTETAEILFPYREMREAPDFRELDFGTFEGKTAEELSGDPAFLEWIRGGMDVRPPEGESVAELSLRSFQGLQRIMQEMRREELYSAVLITHAGVIANLLSCFGVPKLDPKLIRIAPGEGFEIQLSPQMWQQAQAFEILRQVPYLPEEADTF